MKECVTERELIEKISKKISSGDFNDLEKIAIMIMIVAQEREFSSYYHWNYRKEQCNIYNNLLESEEQSNYDCKQLICVTAAKLLKRIAKKFGIDVYYLGSKSNIISFNDFNGFLNGEHIIPLLKINDSEYITVDLERNLDNIKAHKKWYNFGRKDNRSNLLELSDDEIIHIMKKIGYLHDEYDYFDYYIHDLILAPTVESLNRKIASIINDKKIVETVCKLEASVEVFRFYKKMIKEMYELNIISNEILFPFGGKLETNFTRKKYIVGVYYCSENDQVLWMWSNRNNKMEQFSKNEFKYLINTYKISLSSGKDDINADDIININEVDSKCNKIHIEDFLLY